MRPYFSSGPCVKYSGWSLEKLNRPFLNRSHRSDIAKTHLKSIIERQKKLLNIPEDYKKVLEKYCKIFEKFPYICFDMMKDKEGKIYVIESNAQPGVPFDSTVEIYKKVYEDFYGKPLDEKSLQKLDEYANEMIERTLERDKKRFSVKK